MGITRMTIVGGRPPKSKTDYAGIPVGIENLIQRVAVDEASAEAFIADPLGFADASGVSLEKSERAILEIIDRNQLRAFVGIVRDRIGSRRNFLKHAAGFLGLLSAGWTGILTSARAKASVAGSGPLPLDVLAGSAFSTGSIQANVMPAGITPGAVPAPKWLPFATPSPSPSWEETPTVTPMGIMTNTPTATTVAGTTTPSPTSTFVTPTGIPTSSPSPTRTQTPTVTPMGIMTNTPTSTRSPTPTVAPSGTQAPTSSPTRTATATMVAGTTTPSPTNTPSPAGISPTPTVLPPSFTPTPPPDSPTATPSIETGVYIDMPSHFFRPGDKCRLKLNIMNNGSTLTNIPLFVILQVGPSFFCGPDWKQAPELDYYVLETIPNGLSSYDIIQEFDWPSGAGAADNLIFWGGLTASNLADPIGHVDAWKFGFGE